MACCTVGDGESSRDNASVHYLLRLATRQRLFAKYGLRDDVKFYAKMSLLFADMEKQSVVGVITWRNLVSELKGRKDAVVIGVIEDKFPYVVVYYQQNPVMRQILSTGIVVQGERSPAHLAALALLEEFGLEKVKPVTVKDPGGMASWMKEKKLPVLVPVESLSSARMQGWFEVAPLAKRPIIFPQTIVVTSRNWVDRDRGNLANFLALLSEVMAPNVLLDEESVTWGFESIGRQFFRTKEEFRGVVQRRLVEGGRRPPATDLSLMQVGIKLETGWYPYLRGIDPDRLITPRL